MSRPSEELKYPLKNANRKSGGASVPLQISLIAFEFISGKRVFQGTSTYILQDGIYYVGSRLWRGVYRMQTGIRHRICERFGVKLHTGSRREHVDLDYQ